MYQTNVLQEQVYKGLDLIALMGDSSKSLFDSMSYKIFSASMTLDSKLGNVLEKIPDPRGDMGGYFNGPKGLVPGLVLGMGLATVAVLDDKLRYKKNRLFGGLFDYKTCAGLAGAGMVAWQTVRIIEYELAMGTFNNIFG